jgi:hypothetical protein
MLLFLLCCATFPGGGELAAPLRLEAEGVPIDTEIGHAAPISTTGTATAGATCSSVSFLEGKLRIYKNQGSDVEPRFGDLTWFETGGKVVKVPNGVMHRLLSAVGGHER